MSTNEIDSEIKAMLNAGEEVLLVAAQARAVPGGSLTTPNKIYVTNMRILFKDPKFFGLKANIVDVSFKDISNIRLKRGIFSTEIFLKSRFLSDEISLPAVDKQIAQQVSAMIQKGIRGELPRQVSTEDRNSPIEAKTREAMDPLKELEKIGELKQKGFITDDEFKMLKAELLRKIKES
jgi:hypothetical protein